MSNGALPHVARIRQRADDTVEVHVQTDSFKPGQEVEISGYLTQGSGAYVAFNVTTHIPVDSQGSAVLPVELPAMELEAGEDVTVVTRVAEVWPTTLEQEIASAWVGKGLKAEWTPKAPYPGT